MTFNALYGLGPDHGTPDQALFGFWPCQDNAGDGVVADYSGNGRTGNATFFTNQRATSGPTGWLPSAFDFNGLSDWVTLPYAFPGGFVPNGDFAILLRFKANETSGKGTMFGRFNGGRMLDIHAGDPDILVRAEYGQTPFETATRFGRDTGWHNCMFTMYNNGTAQLFVDGSAAEYNPNAAASFDDLSTSLMIGARSPGTEQKFNGPLADVSYFTRALGSVEYRDEWRWGPEPVNSSPPTVGVATLGQLECFTGEWGLPNPFQNGTNGPIVYSFQWSRADDAGGTGAVDIPGATDQRYLITGADVGKWLGCRVAASNTGGNDPASDRDSFNRYEVTAPPETGAALLVSLT